MSRCPLRSCLMAGVHKHCCAAHCVPDSLSLASVCPPATRTRMHMRSELKKSPCCQWLCSRARQQVYQYPHPELMACLGTHHSWWHMSPQQILGKMCKARWRHVWRCQAVKAWGSFMASGEALWGRTLTDISVCTGSSSSPSPGYKSKLVSYLLSSVPSGEASHSLHTEGEGTRESLVSRGQDQLQVRK